VSELKQKEPNLQYVLGMLETVIELSGNPTPPLPDLNMSRKVLENVFSKSDEQEEIPPAARPGPVGRIS